MDTSAKDIKFNENNVCNFCRDFDLNKKNIKKPLKQFQELIINIKNKNKNKDYDCAVALSGGVDSSWLLLKCVEFGLRPLVIHMDNGWNSKLAQTNIYNLVAKLNLHLETYVIDWVEYRSLMDSFFKANVIDIEILMDNAFVGACFKIANKYSLKYIMAGFNNSTEGMEIPENWNWFKKDKKNIININRKFNKTKLKTYPIIGTFDYIYYRFFKNIKWISPLDYLDYNKDDALKELKKKINFEEYSNKHYESIFTRFYQSYILPKKFKVDKRRLHLSNLIITNQITREQGLEMISKPSYDEHKIKEEIEYFLKKMDWDNTRLINYLNNKPVDHNYYGSELKLWKFFTQIFNILKN